jgi:predicted ATPase
MSELSSVMSAFDHHFVASISTDDIVELLTGRYAEISEHTNTLHEDLSNFISAKISQYTDRQRRTEAAQLKSATSILNDIAARVERDDQRREELLKPFSVLSELVSSVFQHRGIQVSEAITLGEARGAVASDKLSAGEKQMLSFLCYNALIPRSMIFIDEPELSLHVDWQRRLFPTLLAQETGNQFIVATHSPFIYSKYPEKELALDADRGGN